MSWQKNVTGVFFVNGYLLAAAGDFATIIAFL